MGNTGIYGARGVAGLMHPAPPMRRWFVLLLMLYLALDLTNPFMPGAFNFDPDESFEGSRSVRRGDDQLVVVTAPALERASTTVDIRLPARPRHEVAPVAGLLRDWFVDLRRAQSAFDDRPPLSEDH